MTDFKDMTESEKLDAIYAEVKAQGAAQKEYHAAQRGFMKIAIGFMIFSGIAQFATCSKAAQTNATIRQWQQGLDMLQRDLERETPSQDSVTIEVVPYDRPQDKPRFAPKRQEKEFDENAPRRLETWPIDETPRDPEILTI